MTGRSVLGRGFDGLKLLVDKGCKVVPSFRSPWRKQIPVLEKLLTLKRK
jgi:hypothetical protein